MAKKFSELDMDGRVAVLHASIFPRLGNLDLSLLPEEEVLNVISVCRKTRLGDNFGIFLLNTLQRVAEETVAKAEAFVAAGDFEAAKRVRGRISSNPKCDFSDLLDEEVGGTYWVEKSKWSALRYQINGYRPVAKNLTTLQLTYELNRRWLAVWLAIERTEDEPSVLHGSLENRLREWAVSGNHDAQIVLQEFYCPRCNARVEEGLQDEYDGWDCCPSCKEAGADWCGFCLREVVEGECYCT